MNPERNYNHLLAVDLRQLLRARGLPVSGTKYTLIRRLEDYDQGVRWPPERKIISPRDRHQGPNILNLVHEDPAILRDPDNYRRFVAALNGLAFPEFRRYAFQINFPLPKRIKKIDAIERIIDEMVKRRNLLPERRKALPLQPRPERNLTLPDLIDEIKAIPLEDNAPLANLQRNYDLQRQSNKDVATMINSFSYLRQDDPVTYLGRVYSVDILMAEPKRIGPIGRELFYDFTHLLFDQALQLLWWENIFNVPDQLLSHEKEFLSGLPPEKLRQIAQEVNYTESNDLASIIWALVKRQRPPFPHVTQDPAYQELIPMNKKNIIRDAALLHNYYNTEIEIPSLLTPYRHLVISPVSPLDPFILTYNGMIDSFAQALQLIFPRGITQRDKEKYFFTNLKDYQEIFTRPPNFPPPPDINGATQDQVLNTLRPYTDIELVEGYEVTSFDWNSRIDFLKKLAFEAHGAAKWFFRNRYCKNDETINIATGDLREKNDPEDPILAYGTISNYKCYNLSELEMAFRETEAGFLFMVPDWKAGEILQTFPTDSIVQLRELIIKENNPLYADLIRKIDEGFLQMKSATHRLRGLKHEYNRFFPQEQEKIRDYLAWLFFYSMFARFWEGPGHIYPVIWAEGRRRTGAGGDYCDLATRDTKVLEWQALRTRILESMSPELERWILALPRVQYNFQTGDAALGRETIDFVIEKIIESQFCLADGSDRVGQTAYFLITQLLEMDLLQLNRFLQEEMPDLYQKYESLLEKSTLESLIRSIETVHLTNLDTYRNSFLRLVNKLYENPPRVPQKRKGLLKLGVETLQRLPRLQAEKLDRIKRQAANQSQFQPEAMEWSRHRETNIRLQEVNQDEVD